MNPFYTVDKDNTDNMEEALQQLAADMAKKASCKQISPVSYSYMLLLHNSDLYIKKSTWNSWKVTVVQKPL